MSSKALVIPAAGSGSRLEQNTPKPYLKLAGKTILEHTVRRFLSLDGLCRIIVATSGSRRSAAEDVLDSILPGYIDGYCVAGGKERQHSIYNALKETGDTDLVLVHDAVRPFVRESVIEACCRLASETGAAVPGVPVRDTIKRVGDDMAVKETPSRKFLWQAQTPQVFRREILLEAYNKAFEDSYIGTDDSSLVERLGYEVRMVESDHTNFKITYPLDLKLARLMVEKEER